MMGKKAKKSNSGRHHRFCRAMVLLLCVTLLMGHAFSASQSIPVYADSKDTEKKLEETNEKINSLKEQQAAIDEKLNSYSNDLASVNGQVASLNERIALKEEEIALKEEAIALKQEELALQEELLAQQYEDMKTRIRYMYENGNVSYLTLFLESGSLAQFFNEVEYINRIAKYDRQKLDDYKITILKLETQKANLEEDYATLTADREELEESKNRAKNTQSQLANMVTTAKNEKAQTEQELADQVAAAKAYEEQIERERLAEEMERARRLAAERAAAAAAGQSTWFENNYTEEEGDLILMAAIIYCEAGGEIYEGQLAVGSVVMNRVNSNQFPNTIAGVIYQRNQFAPVASGRFEMCLENGWYAYSLKAAQEVLGGNITNNYLFFHSLAGWTSDFGEVIGNQVFY